MKFNRILCPIDHSQFSDAVNETASVLAAANGAEIVYLHVVIPDTPYGSYAYTNIDEQTALEQERLEQFRPTVEGIKCSHAIDFGTPVSTIVEYARDHQIDLIVLGSHGRTGLLRVLLGSAAEAVVRHADCPVLVVKAHGELKLRSQGPVLCAIDVNEFDQSLVDLAAGLAKQLNAELNLLHITAIPDPENAVWPSYRDLPQALIQDEELLTTIAPSMEGVEVVRHHQSGSPAEKILAVVDEIQPRLLVIGTHGRKGLARLLGSVASKVLRQATCPTLVHRQHRPDNQRAESVGETVDT
jgi:nucleotide-binding universal stress UspA family protein